MVMKYSVGIRLPGLGGDYLDRIKVVNLRRDWLDHEVGIENINWCYDWMWSAFYFRTEEDRVKFILRWL